MSTLTTISKLLFSILIFTNPGSFDDIHGNVKYSVYNIDGSVVVQVHNWEQFIDLDILVGEQRHMTPLRRISTDTYIGGGGCHADTLFIHFLSNLTIFDSDTIMCPEYCKITARIEGYYPLNRIPHIEDDSLSYYNPCKPYNPGRITSFTLQFYKDGQCIYNQFREGNIVTKFEKQLVKDSLNRGDLLLLRDMVIEYVDTTITNDTLTSLNLYFPPYNQTSK